MRHSHTDPLKAPVLHRPAHWGAGGPLLATHGQEGGDEVLVAHPHG